MDCAGEKFSLFNVVNTGDAPLSNFTAPNNAEL